jgi:hypothetical protein
MADAVVLVGVAGIRLPLQIPMNQPHHIFRWFLRGVARDLPAKGVRQRRELL